jgi:hypothetical protein
MADASAHVKLREMLGRVLVAIGDKDGPRMERHLLRLAAEARRRLDSMPARQKEPSPEEGKCVDCGKPATFTPDGSTGARCGPCNFIYHVLS